MKKLINKLKQLIKEDEQIGTPHDMYSWTKQQGVLITRNDAEKIVNYYNNNQFLDIEYHDKILDIALDIVFLKHGDNTEQGEGFNSDLSKIHDYITNFIKKK